MTRALSVLLSTLLLVSPVLAETSQPQSFEFSIVQPAVDAWSEAYEQGDGRAQYVLMSEGMQRDFLSKHGAQSIDEGRNFVINPQDLLVYLYTSGHYILCR